MNTATSKSSCTIPPQLDKRETEMLGTRVRAACFESLGCAEMSYARAGISFEQDGRFTKAKHSGLTVASMMGRFSKELLLKTIRSNIAESTHQVAIDFFPRLKSTLVLPRGHVFAYDVDASVLQVAQRGSRRITAYVFRPLGSSGDTFYSEIHLDLQVCQAQITFKIGDRWGCGQTILGDNQVTVQADTYRELSDLVSLTFNGAYSTHVGIIDSGPQIEKCPVCNGAGDKLIGWKNRYKCRACDGSGNYPNPVRIAGLLDPNEVQALFYALDAASHRDGMVMAGLSNLGLVNGSRSGDNASHFTELGIEVKKALETAGFSKQA
ncbi:hypothetical protein QO021_28790 (plasmid) [Pseudomonas amygdali pv. lachrymans]|uniref:hypothetical protein n=1 Tax=Pseudomonas amygdali TaxID=47877 RepID=UPI0006CCA4D9|nr:hypothetical protein [Pseudomonas amygdali]KPC02258.1 Uncharacterized protein AC501_3544 [Pseudomonas amygdali pv. lachrymans]RMM39344.1 hypothetical protein ALQ79_200768 [Pseudomonas amygdali pv. lachrymans]WIO61557.1 hypothetical protein QO021_28790 [Pseudomonas amygdali pv. lachrymans]